MLVTNIINTIISANIIPSTAITNDLCTTVTTTLTLTLPMSLSGIILLVLANNTDNETAFFAAGCVLVVLPVLILTTVVLLCINQNKLCCQTRNNKVSLIEKKNVESNLMTHTFSFVKENPQSFSSERQDIFFHFLAYILILFEHEIY